ncbi:gamma-glutamyl-gamma-aminobutyrate hydrolase family protein [Lujinxingia sediminis]|uniref:Gamma-glutamyl-gamma-aminobutyrate hydrolase family protein n=1 Tax=Lujinxingia sediminis TaxID=2480984 RepID=A0ABY0CY45_9DELT|nr:gamma-glutamyl-gamma-aminobutyrate hydrolase family protein [Lujinxingia sediminis]RVU48598.1 gamma-glutamyl-gamma-aminobutyrate hydrolase family protein [Lujinxingia sediminis]
MSDQPSRPLRVGVSANWMHADPERTVYNGRPLLYMEQSMSDWFLAAGALPLMIPAPSPTCEVAITAEQMVGALDALVVAGGADVWPGSYGEGALRPEWEGDRRRDEAEIALIRAALALDVPVLGICRGHQVLNVALGGTLFQDIATQVEGALRHRDAERYAGSIHEVTFLEGGYLHRIYGQVQAFINSVHHQAIKDLAPGLRVTARSTRDSIIEGVQLDDGSDRWVVGVQWHPEFQRPEQVELVPAAPLMNDFLKAARRRASTR